MNEWFLEWGSCRNLWQSKGFFLSKNILITSINVSVLPRQRRHSWGLRRGLFEYFAICLFVYLSVCLFVSGSAPLQPIRSKHSLGWGRGFMRMSVCVSVHLSVCRTESKWAFLRGLSVCKCVDLSVCLCAVSNRRRYSWGWGRALSVCLSVHLSVFLSIRRFS